MANPADVATQEYIDFLDSPFKVNDVTVLEVHPKVELTTWAAAPGFTNAYYTPFSNYFAENKTSGGIYRKLVELREDATELTKHDFVGPVIDATGGSQGAWCYHEGHAVTNYTGKSQLFTTTHASGGWAKYQCSMGDVGGGVLAPDHTVTADLLTEDSTASSTHVVYQDRVIPADQQWVFSVYCQEPPTNAREWVCLSVQDSGNGVRGWFRVGGVTNSVVGTLETVGSGATAVGSAIEEIDLSDYSGGDKWTRCSITFRMPVGITNARQLIYLADQDDAINYTGDGASGLRIWGAQLESSASAGRYVRNDNTRTGSAVTLGKNWVVANTTTGGQNPDLAGTMVGAFRLHFASAPKIFDGIYYEPRLSMGSLPDIHMEAEDLFFGPIKKTAEGEFAILNADGAFDEAAHAWAWNNAEVKLYYGGGDLVHTHSPYETDQYANIGSFYCEDFTPGFLESSISVRGKQKAAWTNIPPRTFSGANYELVAEGDASKPIPLLFGHKKGLTPTFIGGTTTRVYLICDNAYQTLYSIDTVYNDGVPISPSYLTKNLAGCAFEIDDSFGDLGTITCDAKGPQDRGAPIAPWTTSSDYLKYYGEIACEIYNQFLGIGVAGISSAAAISCDSQEPSPQALYITEAAPARTYIRELELGVMGRTIERFDGLIVPTVWFPTVGITTGYIASFTEEDISVYDTDIVYSTLFSKINVRGDKDPGSSEYRVVGEEDNDTVKYLQLDGADVHRTMDTALITDGAAKSLAGRVKFVSEMPAKNVRMVESTGHLLLADIGDKVKLTLDRAPATDGEWDGEVLEIVSLTKSFAPHPQVEFIVNDLSAKETAWGEWQDNTANTWPTGSGWWCDDLGYASSGITASRYVSIWG